MNLGWERTALLNDAAGFARFDRLNHVLQGVASGVQVTKVDCPRFPGPHIISTLPARIEDRSS